MLTVVFDNGLPDLSVLHRVYLISVRDNTHIFQKNRSGKRPQIYRSVASDKIWDLIDMEVDPPERTDLRYKLSTAILAFMYSIYTGITNAR